MRNNKWLRYGLASLMMGAGGIGTFLVACGDDDSGSTPGVDSGTPDSPGTDSNTTPPDGGGDASDGGGPEPAKIIVVHGATDYGPASTAPANGLGIMRVCYATAPKTDPSNFVLSPLPPLPHSNAPNSIFPFPGIPMGTGGPFPSTGLPLEDIAIRPYLINGASLAAKGIIGNTGAAAQNRCNKLLGTPNFAPDGGWPDGGGTEPLVENVDYWKLGDIPTNTFLNGKTYILAIYGCAQDADPVANPPGKCGPDNAGAPYVPLGAGNPGVGNLKIVVLELDTSPVAADELGVQVVHMSPSYQTQFGAAPGFEPLISVDGGEAGAPVVTIDGGNRLAFDPAAKKATGLVKLKGLVTNAGYWAHAPDFPPGQGPFIKFALNNSGGTPSIQLVSVGLGPDYIVNGKAYTFILIGDPGVTPTPGQTRAIHTMAFPNIFTPPPAN